MNENRDAFESPRDESRDAVREELWDAARDELGDAAQREHEDAARDGWDHRTLPERDEIRDHERDEARDAARDEDRDGSRDGIRDAERDGVRDAERDGVRDAERDEVRDAEHDEDRDAELSYDRSIGRSHDPLGARKDVRNHPSFEDDDVALIVSMAEECSDLIKAWDEPTPDQPPSLQPKHLEWMCNRLRERADTWPKTKLHRWIGFIQAGMIANGMIRLDGAKTMFDVVKQFHPGLDQDLLDHLDLDDSFELDIGGEG